MRSRLASWMGSTSRASIDGLGLAALLLWLFVAAVPYFEVLRAANEVPRVLSAMAWVDRREWSLDYYAAHGWSLGPDVARSPSNAKLYPNKPPGTTAVAVPALAVARALEKPDEPLTLGQATTWTRLVAGWLPIVLGLVTVLMWHHRRRAQVEDQAGSKVVAVAFVALATPWASYGKLAYGHALSGFLLAIGVALLVDASIHTRSPARVGLAAFLLAATVSVEYMLALFVAPWLALWGFRRVRQRAWLSLLGAALGGLVGLAPLVIYQHAAFGSPWRTGYHSVIAADLAAKHAQGFLGLVGPNLEALWHTWFNPACGALFWVPWLPFAVRGWWLSRGVANLKPWLEAALWISASAAVIVSSLEFQGGWRVGPRYLVPVMPLWGVGLWASWHLEKKTWLKAAGAVALGWAAASNLALAAWWPHVDTDHIRSPLAEVIAPLWQRGVHPLGVAQAWPHLAWLAGVLILPLSALAWWLNCVQHELGSRQPWRVVLWFALGVALTWPVAAMFSPHRHAARNLRYVFNVYEKQDEPSRPLLK